MKRQDYSLKRLISEINNSPVDTLEENLADRSVVLSARPSVITDLSGWIGAFIIRSILLKLGINEHHIFKWRPENKYIQFLILSHYARGCIPHTLSLSAILENNNWVTNIRKLIKAGYFIKATLGFDSGGSNNFDRTSEFEQILHSYTEEDTFQNEKWIVQKRLKLAKEYRIHTFGKDIIYGVTLMAGGTNELNNFERPQEFINLILKKLPSPLLKGTLIGWDVGLTKKGKLYVIEANFTGFHSVFKPGFQTTGYVDTPPLGPVVCAIICCYFRNKYNLSITSEEGLQMNGNPYMEEFSYFISIFNNERINALFNSKGRVEAFYIHLDEQTEFHVIKLIVYLQLANLADTIFIITSDHLIDEAKRQFEGSRIKHVSESSLFTDSQYKKMQGLNYENRKKMCYCQMMKLVKGHSYIVI